MSGNVEQRLERIINLVNLKIKPFLDLCETEVERMFLLNYFEQVFDSITGNWFSYGLEEQQKPFYQYPDNEEYGKYYPESLKWYETNNLEVRKAISPHLIQLFPQYEIKDKSGAIKYKLAFALFYPRTDGYMDKIKIAIECDGHKFSKNSKEQIWYDKEKDDFLRSDGWIIARFTGAEIYRKDIYDLIGEIDNLAIDKDYELFQSTEKQKDNWKYN